ncbi:indolepyruvate ferredoxin oxidoreductase subunit alpha [Lachnospiraceae bacterium 50-23]
MAKRLLMGNEAIGLGAIRAGVDLVAGYPGTPSTEILETVAKYNQDKKIHVQWSVNEKAALEVAAGGAYAGARTLVTMKQVGLNVASDPLMSLAYVGVKGGMVIVVADDPGPISSQTEQDTRHFGAFSKLPVFDPVSPEEAYDMVGEAFELSEKYCTPVILRPTTRICHGCAGMEVGEDVLRKAPEGFQKDTGRWVIFPRLSYENHKKMEARNKELSTVFSSGRYNRIEGNTEAKKGIASGGISYTYMKETVPEEVKILKVGTPHPFPEELAVQFLTGLSEVLVLEELDPVIEKELVYLAGKYHLPVTVKGKLTGDTKNAGENSVESVCGDMARFLPEYEINREETGEGEETDDMPELPLRPPVLCAGCPHRASFYAVKEAVGRRKAVYSGDIGCYTLGNARPLDMVDTCLCMGADVTIAQGIHIIEPDTVNFSFIGDSTFFASGITGVINAVYNGTDIVLVVLDNSTTAMTGHQPHPGTGVTMMGDVTQSISIEKVLEGIGVKRIVTADPLNLAEAVKAVEDVMEEKGVRAVIFRSPCIAVAKDSSSYMVEESRCTSCARCIRKLGCPAITRKEGRVYIEPSLCFGCGVCTQVCKFEAIKEVSRHE